MALSTPKASQVRGLVDWLQLAVLLVTVASVFVLFGRREEQLETVRGVLTDQVKVNLEQVSILVRHEAEIVELRKQLDHHIDKFDKHP